MSTALSVQSPTSYLPSPFDMADSSDARQHLDQTIDVLDSGVAALSPAAARGVIERWLNVLADHPELNDVATALGELRAALADLPLDAARIGPILGRLGSRTTDAADGAEDDATTAKLQRLGALLSRASDALGRDGAPAQPTAAADGVVQQQSTPHGENPTNPGGTAEVGGVGPNVPSETPGTKYDPK